MDGEGDAVVGGREDGGDEVFLSTEVRAEVSRAEAFANIFEGGVDGNAGSTFVVDQVGPALKTDDLVELAMCICDGIEIVRQVQQRIKHHDSHLVVLY